MLSAVPALHQTIALFTRCRAVTRNRVAIRDSSMKNPYTYTTEKQLREQVRDLCKKLGWMFYFTWTSIHSPRGMPDLILVKPPRVLFVELKTEKGELSDYQKTWTDVLGRCGGNVECYILKPSGIDEFVQIMRRC